MSNSWAIALCLLAMGVHAQPARPALGDGPWEYTTYEQGGTDIRVSIVTRGLRNPWSMVWLPTDDPRGDMLITERAGQLRRINDGTLDAMPLTGLEEFAIDRLFDIALHPDLPTTVSSTSPISRAAPTPTAAIRIGRPRRCCAGD